MGLSKPKILDNLLDAIDDNNNSFNSIIDCIDNSQGVLSKECLHGKKVSIGRGSAGNCPKKDGSEVYYFLKV